MKTTRRRYWVFFLLFLFNLIAYVDRVNMSVAGKPIAQEFGLSPVALCINLMSALASARFVSSVSAPINVATLNWVGLVLLSAIRDRKSVV